MDLVTAKAFLLPTIGDDGFVHFSIRCALLSLRRLTPSHSSKSRTLLAPVAESKLQLCVYPSQQQPSCSPRPLCRILRREGQMVLRLVGAIDVYLAGTVMLIFGMGLYGLFISNVPTDLPSTNDRALKGSSLFGMFTLKERPKWMKISSLDELKTKVGHVIVMILLVKMFERSKMVAIATGMDLLSYSAHQSV
ncbi:hypothetical protein NE237_031653 [Protea cynaroides]|uniref:Uncharacterized protein n=1 Tax=Protea cynaroides TaxID=273540 RepID=A0A9Q0L1Z7_9MAGN|nr:hypothetical protein NE237_031653 [Protea cynaroides]